MLIGAAAEGGGPVSTFHWPSDDGWPYPDGEAGMVDVEGLFDDDALNLRAGSAHLLDHLEPLERQVITAHYGLDGRPVRTMKELHNDLGVPREELRTALGTALAKLRAQLG